MIKKTITFAILILVFNLSAQVKAIYKDKNAPSEARIKDLVSKMTLSEKIMQLNQYSLGFNTNVNNIGETKNTIPNELAHSYISEMIQFIVMKFRRMQ